MRALGYIVVFLLILIAGISCSVWRWQECRHVGHSVLYCIGKVTSK